jgi:hypothetical protein
MKIYLLNGKLAFNACKTIEERIFYILYARKEKLNYREMLRCLKNNTFASLTGGKHNLSKVLKNIYLQITPMLKDTIFIDFLGLPKRSLSPTMVAEYNRQLIPKEVLQCSLEEFTHFLNPKNKK